MLDRLRRLLTPVQKTHHSDNESTLLAIGTLLSNQQQLLNTNNINDYEFKIFSQFGDDGIIQFLIKNIKIENQVFIEFGVEDYMESNTRFLMMNNNWSGFVMDSSQEALDRLVQQSWYWKYSLDKKIAFIDKDNINSLLAATELCNVGLLHIDLDGNDYHILREIDLIRLNPSILIMEYNSVFGDKRLISIPYDQNFVRSEVHHSNLFWGASLPAINYMATKKGYCLVGSNLAGNNAYFVRKDLLNKKVYQVEVSTAFKESKYREGRNEDGSLSYLSGSQRLESIKGLKVLNVETNELEDL